MKDLHSLDKVKSAAAAKALRRQVPMEGQPLLGVFGLLEWFLLFLAIVAFYALQFIELQPITKHAQSLWLLVAGGYTAVVLAHGILTTRDG